MPARRVVERAVGERSGAAVGRPARGGPGRIRSWSSGRGGGGSRRSTSCGFCVRPTGARGRGRSAALLRREGLVYVAFDGVA